MPLTIVENGGQTAECCDCESLAELRAAPGAHRQGVGVEREKRLCGFASERVEFLGGSDTSTERAKPARKTERTPGLQSFCRGRYISLSRRSNQLDPSETGAELTLIPQDLHPPCSLLAGVRESRAHRPEFRKSELEPNSDCSVSLTCSGGGLSSLSRHSIVHRQLLALAFSILTFSFCRCNFFPRSSLDRPNLSQLAISFTAPSAFLKNLRNDLPLPRH